jgi:tetratricopeptide (TPR) repeat protein
LIQRAKPLNMKMMKGNKLVVLIAVLIVVSALLAAFYFGISVPRERAETAYAKGIQVLRSGDLQQALNTFEKAYSESKTQTPAGLVLVDQLLLHDQTRAEAILSDLEASGKFEESAIAQRIQLDLVNGDLEAAASHAKELAKRSPEGFRGKYALVLQQFAAAKDDLAKSGLQELLQSFPEKREIKLLLARVLLTSDHEVDQVRAKKILMQLLDQTDSVSLEAALDLIAHVDVDFFLFETDMQAVADHLRKHPFTIPTATQLPTEMIRSCVVNLQGLAPEVALEISRLLIAREDSSPIDILLHIETCMAAGRSNDASQFLDKLEAKEDRIPEETLTLANNAIREGEYLSALSLIEEVLQKDPGNSPAYRMMQQLAEAKDRIQSVSARLSLLRQLAQHPLSGPSSSLAAASMMINLDDLNRDTYIGEAISSFALQSPALVASWLVSIGEAESALNLVPQDLVGQDPEALMARIQALGELGRFEELLQLVEAHPDLLDEAERALAITRARTGMGDTEAALDQLRETYMLVQSVNRTDLYPTIGILAGELGDRDFQETAYRAAFDSGVVLPRAQAIEFLGLLMKDSTIEEAMQYASYRRSLNRRDPFAINNDCYLQLINGENLQVCLSDLEDLVETYPDIQNFRGTLALAQILNDLPEAAMETLEHISSKEHRSSSQSRMISAIVLADSGNQGLAGNVAASINPDELLEVERELLRKFGLLSRGQGS